MGQAVWSQRLLHPIFAFDARCIAKLEAPKLRILE
jgi:hypothetical protein